MFKKNTLTLALASLFSVAAAQAAVLSDPTEKVVGFKPFYKNTDGAGSVNGELSAGKELTVDASKLQFFDEDGDLADPSATTYDWQLGGVSIGNASTVTIPADAGSVGKKLTLTVTPVAASGDPLIGKPLVLTDLRAAGATGGDTDGNITVNTTLSPKVDNLKMAGKLAQGEQLTATYSFIPQGGDTTDHTKYAWGFKGATATAVVSTGTQVTQSGSVGAYTVQPTDAGQVLELSVQAINGASVTGNTVTLDTTGAVTGGNGNIDDVITVDVIDGEVPYVKLDPTRVELNVTSTATLDANGYEGNYPVANKDQVTAVITPALGASPKVADYTFQWKVDGVDVGTSTVGGATFLPAVTHQGKQVTVEVAPAPASASR